MGLLTNRARRRWPALGAAAVGTVVLTGCSADTVAQWSRAGLPEAASDRAVFIGDLWTWSWVGSMVVGVFVWALIGWAAVTGSLSLEPWILFLIVFAWTPPHFWSLALWAHDDYARAGVPMLPVTAGARETRRQILIYAVLLAPIGLLPSVIGFAGPAYAAIAAAMGMGFVYHAVAVLRDRQDAEGRSLTRDAPARACFRFSLYYLSVILAALALDRLVIGP